MLLWAPWYLCLTLYWSNWCPENTRHWPTAGLMLVHRLRRCPNIEPILGQRLRFAGWEMDGQRSIRNLYLKMVFTCEQIRMP